MVSYGFLYRLAQGGTAAVIGAGCFRKNRLPIAEYLVFTAGANHVRSLGEYAYVPGNGIGLRHELE